MTLEQIQLFLGIAIIVIMLGMGLSLTLNDFKRVKERPKAIFIGLLAQLVILPIIALILINSFDLDGVSAVGVFLIAVSPGGAVSNMFTHLAKGDLVLSISLTACASLITIFSVPMILEWAVNHYLNISDGGEMVSKKDFFQTLLLLILVPISIGMTIRHFKPKTAIIFEKPVKIAAIILLSSIVIIAIVTNKERLMTALPTVGPAVILLNIVTMIIGGVVAKYLKLSSREQTTITIEGGIQNGTLAMNLATVGILGQFTELVLPAALYSVWMFVSGGVYSFIQYKRKS